MTDGDVVVGAVQQFGPVAETLLAALWRASWQAALIALVLLALQWILRDRLAARWRHALWLLVFARLALPVLPPSPTSAFQLVQRQTLPTPAPLAASRTPAAEQPAALAKPQVADATRRAETTTTTAAVKPSSSSSSPANQPLPSPPRPSQQQLPRGATERPKLADPIQGPAAPRTSGPADSPSADRSAAANAGPGAQPPAVPTAQPRLRERSQARELAISLIWLAGAAALLLRTIVASVRLATIRRRLIRISSPSMLELLDATRNELRIGRRIELLTSDVMKAPALIGLLRPAIVLPRQVLARMSRPELRLVLLHELAHVKRRDLLVNWLTALLTAVHWFNPIVWVVVARMRTDRELACDEMVLARTAAHGGADRRAAYGGVLVKLIEAIAAAQALPRRRRPIRAGTAVLENAHQLQQRVRWIATFAPPRRGWSLLALAAAVVVCLTLLTEPVTGQYVRAMREFLTPLPKPGIDAALSQGGEPVEIVITCPITALSNYLSTNGPDLRQKLGGIAWVSSTSSASSTPSDSSDVSDVSLPPATQPTAQPSRDVIVVNDPSDVWRAEDAADLDPNVIVGEPVWEPGNVRIASPTVGTSVERLAYSVQRRRKQAEAEAQVIMEQIADFRRANPNVMHAEAFTKQVATVSQALLEAHLELIDTRAKYGEHHDRTKAAQAKHDELARLNDQTVKRTAALNDAMAEYQLLTAALAQKQELIRRLDDRAVSLEEMGQIIRGMGGEGRPPATNPVGQEASPLPPRLIVVDEKMRAANDAAARRLEQPISELSFDRTPMHEVVAHFGRLAPGINVYVDWNALMTCGVDSNARVSIQLRDVPLGVAIEQTLRAAHAQAGNAGRTRLTYLIDHGNVSLTSEEEADKILMTITYDVSDLARDARSLDRVIALIRQSVRPQVWRDASADGPGEIGGFGGKLVVTVNDTTQREIAKLLDNLRASPTTAPALWGRG